MTSNVMITTLASAAADDDGLGDGDGDGSDDVTLSDGLGERTGGALVDEAVEGTAVPPGL